MKYRDYLQTDHWKILRTKRLARDGHKCVVCGSTERLEVHHIGYRKSWLDTTCGDLETLCHICHDSTHKDKKVFKRFANRLKARRKILKNPFRPTVKKPLRPIFKPKIYFIKPPVFKPII